jgi:hypothetical protein
MAQTPPGDFLQFADVQFVRNGTMPDAMRPPQS